MHPLNPRARLIPGLIGTGIFLFFLGLITPTVIGMAHPSHASTLQDFQSTSTQDPFYGFEATPTADFSFAATETPEPSSPTSNVLQGTDDDFTFLPFISLMPTPTPIPTPIQLLVCDQPGIAIPDNDRNGIRQSMNLSQSGYITDLNVFVYTPHTWVGDLEISLQAPGGAPRLDLLDRPGYPSSTIGCGNNTVQAIFDDQALQWAENKCALSPAAVGGSFRPLDPLETLTGFPAGGQWTLSIADVYPYDTGNLMEWCLDMMISQVPPTPGLPPPPVSYLPSATIYGISGKDQSLPLDCESRSAVDWAKYFGVYIDELEFFARLPSSDNPEKGFVGDVYGTWGQIPPADYGVHAEPVAALLRQYGLNARAVKHLTYDQLRAEISASRPVIVWVTGSVANGAPNYYQAASDHGISVVARYEHTVIVIGYSANAVTLLDGSKVYSRSVEQFLDSWSVLQNMAIILQP